MLEFRFHTMKRFSSWYWRSVSATFGHCSNLCRGLNFLPQPTLELKDILQKQLLILSLLHCLRGCVVSLSLFHTARGWRDRTWKSWVTTGSALTPWEKNHSQFQNDPWPPHSTSDSFVIKRKTLPPLGPRSCYLFSDDGSQCKYPVFCHIVKMTIPNIK